MTGNRGKMSQWKVGVCLYVTDFQDFAIIKLNVKGEVVKFWLPGLSATKGKG